VWRLGGDASKPLVRDQAERVGDNRVELRAAAARDLGAGAPAMLIARR